MSVPPADDLAPDDPAGPTGLADPADLADAELADRLRPRGLRVTRQRRDVLAAVRRLGHATPEELHGQVDDADLTTIYRTLDVLEDVGLVRHAHLGHGAPSFRPAEDDHVHVVCHRCGAVLDAPADLADPLADRLAAEQGFVIDRAHFTVFGKCAACAAVDPA